MPGNNPNPAGFTWAKFGRGGGAVALPDALPQGTFKQTFLQSDDVRWGDVKPGVLQALEAVNVNLIQSGNPGIRVTSAYNGAHRIGSAHYESRAVDITPANLIGVPNGSLTERQAGFVDALIVELQRAGFTVLDEYRNPSKKSTAGHLHVTWDRGGWE